MAYHYIDSGLDNIYLENGYTVHKTSYGEGISIQDAEGLHRAIGKRLISQRYPLNGAEFRFLRMEMELTQNALAGLIGSTEQTFVGGRRPKRKTFKVRQIACYAFSITSMLVEIVPFAEW